MRVLCLLILSVPVAAFADPINAVIGDESWIALHGEAPEQVDEGDRIRVHLSHVEARLRAADVSHLGADPRARRSQALAALATYREQGVFPRRTDDAFVGRRPRFIDDRGVHCAVGQLIAATGFPELALRIRDAHEYAYVPDIDDPELLEWAHLHGFTVRELAMIQPAYAPPPTAESTRESIEQMKDRITIECARDHEPPTSIRLRVRGDRQGEVRVRARGNDFVDCFVSKLTGLGAGGAWDQQPSRFRMRMRVEITPVPELLEVGLRRLDVERTATSCIPRPGPTPDRAFFNIRIDRRRGVRVGTRTEPRNPEVERCLRDWVREWLTAFGPGHWRLHFRAPNLPMGRVMNSDDLQSRLDDVARSSATECFEHGAPERAVVRASAQIDRPLAIAVEGGEPAWRECVEQHVQEQLRRSFSVNRRLRDGTVERYFRADAAAEAELAFEVESSEARERRARDEGERLRREMENLQTH